MGGSGEAGLCLIYLHCTLIYAVCAYPYCYKGIYLCLAHHFPEGFFLLSFFNLCGWSIHLPALSAMPFAMDRRVLFLEGPCSLHSFALSGKLHSPFRSPQDSSEPTATLASAQSPILQLDCGCCKLSHSSVAIRRPVPPSIIMWHQQMLLPYDLGTLDLSLGHSFICRMPPIQRAVRWPEMVFARLLHLCCYFKLILSHAHVHHSHTPLCTAGSVDAV